MEKGPVDPEDAQTSPGPSFVSTASSAATEKFVANRNPKRKQGQEVYRLAYASGYKKNVSIRTRGFILINTAAGG